MMLSRFVLTTLFLAGSAIAAPIVFSGTLAPEAVGATGTGTATVTMDVAADTLRVQVIFSGLSGNTTASHIHCCTAAPFTGTAGVATVTPTFTGFPGGVTAGSYDHTFVLSAAAGTWNNAFVTAQGSIANATTALLTGMTNGSAYLNVHTSTFPGGEIRAFLTETPEPSTFALAGIAMAGLALIRRKRC